MRLGKIVATGALALSLLGLPAWADTGLVRGGTGISEGAADGLYVKQDGSLDPDMTGQLTIDLAGLPLYLINDTDNASNEVLRLYSNRATPTDGDAAFINFNLNTTTPTETTFGRIAVTAEDATAAIVDGLFSVYLQEGSVLTEMFKISAKNSLAELIGVDLQVGGNVEVGDGIAYAPGSDTDVNLLTVSVTGTPTVKWDESADGFNLNKNLVAAYAGLPLTATNTTDSADLDLFKLYANRGTGANNDTLSILFQFDDDLGSPSIPVRLVAVMGDADAKGGTTGNIEIRTGSAAPTTFFTMDGVNDRVLANRFGLIAAPTNGMTGGSGILNIQTEGLTRMQFVTASTHIRVEDWDWVIDHNASVGSEFAVGSTVGAMENSAIFQVTSTTLGSISAPLMTTAQAAAIASKDVGIEVNDSDLNARKRWNGTSFEVFAVGVPTLKSGTVDGTTFAGNPKIFTVTFGTAFPDTNYAVTITAEDSRTFTFQTKLAGSFVMNSNANLALTGDVDWTATAHNDP